jgi:predicted RNA binding protein YcfA (HicA-like mRNA interferase family)
MPRKVRELESELKRAGFKCISGKGSHRKYKHTSGVVVMISGGTGSDAKAYQETQVALAIAEVKR